MPNYSTLSPSCGAYFFYGICYSRVSYLALAKTKTGAFELPLTRIEVLYKMKDFRTDKNIGLIWKHTHQDFKGSSAGERSIMWHCGSRGSVISPISNLPDDVFLSRLNSAIRAEVCEIRDKKLKPIYTEFGLASLFSQTAQFRESLETVTYVFTNHLDECSAQLALDKVRDAFVPFPEGPDSDGVLITGSVTSVKKASPGDLVLVVERPTQTVSRFFSGVNEDLWKMYIAAETNKYVRSYSFI